MIFDCFFVGLRYVFCTSLNLKLLCQFCKSKQNQFHVCNLYKTQKLTKTIFSNFGLIEETLDLIVSCLNKQYMTNRTIFSPVKMKYGWNFSISGLKIMVKSGLKKIFLKFLHALTMSFLLLNLYCWSKFLLSMRYLNSFNRKWQAHGGISEIFLLDYFSP